MIDIFLQNDVAKLLRNKNVVFMGDSNNRALYKDMLCISQHGNFIGQKVLKTKMEKSCFGDTLLRHGPKYNGREYREEREGNVNGMKLSYFFITRVYDKYVAEILDYISHKSRMPDVLIINSCLWDVTRWGPNGVKLYKENLTTLMKELKRRVPSCLVIWVTTPPIACELDGGFLVKELQFLKYSLRFHVMEANHYARKIVVENGFDVLDAHYHLKMQIHRRAEDGIHWLPPAVRYITNLLLTHISLAWDIPLPHRYDSIKPDNSEPITKEETVIKSEIQQKRPISVVQIASVIGKDQTSENKNSIEKENNTPKYCKKHGRSKKKRVALQESHHAHISRVQLNTRQKRIRQWQTGSSQSRNLLQEPPAQSTYTLQRHYNQSHDSAYQSHDSAYQSHDSAYQGHDSAYQGHDSAYQCHDSVYYPSPEPAPLLPEPYFNPSSTYYHSTRTTVYAESQSSYQYSSRVIYSPVPTYSNRRVICEPPSQQPYCFPNVYHQPVIDFTSTDKIPFGLQF